MSRFPFIDLRHAGAAALFALAAALAGCTTQPVSGPGVAACAPAPAPVCPVCAVCVPPKPEPAPKVNVFEPADFSQLPGWQREDFAATAAGLRAACARFKAQPAWQNACASLPAGEADPAVIRSFIERNFAPWRISTPEGEVNGLITGYYEPLLRGSRTRQGPFQVPLYAPPDDLLTIDLSAVNPDLRNVRLRGRLVGRRVVPYYSRAEIDHGTAPLAGKEIAWVDDAVEAFFLQIQGSGRIQLPDGQMMRVGYSDQNGHPYVSVGRALIDRGELQAGEATMQGIQAWARSHPQKLPEVLAQNPSYVFFRELPAANPNVGPTGAMGVPLTPQRSAAVDARFIPLGAPLYLATTWPSREDPLERLMFAQDTGGAIRGAVRADFFWGFGAEAGAEAGRMRQQGRLWLLWPRDSAPAEPKA
jgi:membrane-bound lytic murein transglycosylase A